MSVESIVTENLDIWTSAIKTKSSAGRGSSSKLELYGIRKLRELILDLAVRGKLVHQDSSDEPASTLLERAYEQKSKVAQCKKIKSSESVQTIATDEKTFEIQVMIGNKKYSSGFGTNKKTAEQTAAQIALEELGASY